MGKRLYMGDMPMGDNVTTFNLEFSTVLGVGSTTRHDDAGNPSSNPIDTVSMSLRNYIIASPENQADLVGVDFDDELVGTSGDDLILWEQQRHGLGGPYYMLPSGGAAAIDNFNLGAGNDLINLTFISDNNLATPNIPYTANANIDGGTGDDIIWSGQGNDNIFGGGGFTEYLYGGGGDDVVVDLDGGMLYGGLGSDLLVLRSLDQSANYVVDGGRENHISDTLQQGDGNDQVFVGGNYNRVDSALGTGDDKFIASDVNGTGAQIDVVRGGSGNDLISAWYGNDVLYGDDSVAGAGGNDAIWGGAATIRSMAAMAPTSSMAVPATATCG